ncbi:hypothetical protein B0H13DRAFT_1852555 [Mycena leptocephala]|nr:hypothetical protein B0H13DRAFT_1852555 [Mycena leptocephala]
MQGAGVVRCTFGAHVSDWSLSQSVGDIYTPVVDAYTIEFQRESGCLATATSTSRSTDTNLADHRYAALYQWPEPDLIDDLPLTWGLWKLACRVRVEHICSRYTSALIRLLVAQEAMDYFSLYGSSRLDPLSFVGEGESANHGSARRPAIACEPARPHTQKLFPDIVIPPAAGGIPGRGTPVNPVRGAEWTGKGTILEAQRRRAHWRDGP